MHVNVTYPEADAEAQIVALARAEESGAAAGAQGAAQRLAPEAVFAARAEIHGIHVSEAVARYMVALVHATREPKAVDDELDRWIQVGVSRAALSGWTRSRAPMRGCAVATSSRRKTCRPWCTRCSATA